MNQNEGLGDISLVRKIWQNCAALKREWDQIQGNVINKLVDSMLRWVKAVLKSKKGATSY